jgi:hypothetical protein
VDLSSDRLLMNECLFIINFNSKIYCVQTMLVNVSMYYTKHADKYIPPEDERLMVDRISGCFQRTRMQILCLMVYLFW